MSIQAIADELVRLCRTGNYKEVQQKLYAPNAYSEEPFGEPARVDGIEAINEKADWWEQNMEYHGGSVSDPIVADDYFSVIFDVDVTNKLSGVRSRSSEVAVYEVQDGKIISERFFYNK
ncbi:MAG: SnoaL-like domain-containing protein [Bacteroidia bacterium]